VSLLQQAISAIKAGDKAVGQNLLEQFIKTNPQNEVAWLWLAVVQENPARKKECLQRVLKINPGNNTAKQGLAQLEITEMTMDIPKVEDIVQTSSVAKTSPQVAPKTSVPTNVQLSNSLKDFEKDIPYWLCFIFGSILGGLLVTSSISDTSLGVSISRFFLLAAFVGLSICLGIMWFGFTKPEHRWNDEAYKIPWLAWGGCISYIVAFYISSLFGENSRSYIFLLCNTGIIMLILVVYSYKREQRSKQKK
jgi:hypothetical protein